MLEKRGRVWEMFGELKNGIYSRENCNNGHDHEHIERMLAMRQTYWPAILRDEPAADGLEITLDCAILIHDFNRSKDLRGRDKEEQRIASAQNLMRRHAIPERTSLKAIEAVQATFKPDDPNEELLVRLLRDFDKADMGAVGIYRMAAVADSRKYGIFARREDFDPEAPAIQGDANLDSFCADIKFCMDWWTHEKFMIRTEAIRRRVSNRFVYMKRFLYQIRSEIQELGLV